ncbi:MAG: hypothetical protein EBT95_08915, partial [Verrucomicrobia bacterium]|nr:hypothetical protein [Verrucomicrobiota bacterium]
MAAGRIWGEEATGIPTTAPAPPDFLLPPEGWEGTSAKQWAAKLHLPVESETPFQSSYRSYPRSEFRVLGAQPRSIALLASEERPDQLNLVFANKGDSAGDGRTWGGTTQANASLQAKVDAAVAADAD